MTRTNDSAYALPGERTPALLAAALAVAGIAIGTIDVRWALLSDGSLATASVVTALPQRTIPTIRVLSEPVVPAPAAQPHAGPAKPPEISAAKAQDCPPLFPVTFDLGSARPQYDTAALNALVAWLNSHADTNLIVDGHSDSTGSAAVNLGLSQRRANEMVKRIVAVNFPHDRITRRAFGNYTPVVGARQDSARNRRVVLSIAGLKDCPESESQ